MEVGEGKEAKYEMRGKRGRPLSSEPSPVVRPPPAETGN